MSLDRMAEYDRRDRTVKMARTYLRKAQGYLYAYRGKDGKIVEPLPLSAVYWDLIEQALETTLAVIEKLPDDFFEATEVEDFFGLGLGGGKHNSSDDPLERAQKVIAAIERRRSKVKMLARIKALENVEGRSPEEAQAFLDKAAQLRKDMET